MAVEILLQLMANGSSFYVKLNLLYWYGKNYLAWMQQ